MKMAKADLPDDIAACLQSQQSVELGQGQWKQEGVAGGRTGWGKQGLYTG